MTTGDMGRCVRSSIMYPPVASVGEQGLGEAPLAYKLPGTDGALRKVLKSLNALEAAIDAGDPVPPLHGAVAEVQRIADPARRVALLKLLRVEIDGALAATSSKSAADGRAGRVSSQDARDKSGGQDESREGRTSLVTRCTQCCVAWESLASFGCSGNTTKCISKRNRVPSINQLCFPVVLAHT
jgi:hypothetical protein